MIWNTFDIWWSFFYLQSVYASKVEVQDYKLLCLADVEVKDHKFTLVGILGTWWTLPHLQSWEARCSLVGRSILLPRNEQGNPMLNWRTYPSQIFCSESHDFFLSLVSIFRKRLGVSLLQGVRAYYQHGSNSKPPYYLFLQHSNFITGLHL